MKKAFILVAVLAAMCSAGHAQSFGSAENHIQIGAGVSSLDGSSDHLSTAISASYGFDYFFLPYISVMPTVTYSCTSAEIDTFDELDHIKYAQNKYIDLSASLKIHLGNSGIALGVGPYFAYAFDCDDYSVHGSNGHVKLTRYDIGLTPSVTIGAGKHFEIGLKANIGLTDTTENDDDSPDLDKRNFKSGQLFIGFKF